MPQWLFPHSLDEPAVYAEAIRHWQTLWQGVMRGVESARQWRTPWVENRIPDGNPIFTAVGEARGLRVIQEDPRDPDDIDLDWWTDRVEGSGFPELVIACCPSLENTPEVERLLREWLTTGRVSEATADRNTNGSGESASPKKVSSG